MIQKNMTIGTVAEAAGVGIETIRYYQRRGLVTQPDKTRDAYRRYDNGHVERIRFIKRAQALGFSLDEVETLLALEDGADRKTIQSVASARLDEIQRRITDLRRIEQALSHLLNQCKTHSRALRCPIIAAITTVDREE